MALSDPDAFCEWMDWATWYADFIDPLCVIPNRPEFAPTPENTRLSDLDLTRKTRQVLESLGLHDTDDLRCIKKEDLSKSCGSWPWSEWSEICRVLEGLGYPVGDQYHDYGI